MGREGKARDAAGNDVLNRIVLIVREHILYLTIECVLLLAAGNDVLNRIVLILRNAFKLLINTT